MALLRQVLRLCLFVLIVAPAWVAMPTQAAGTFRFLTTTLPDATRNGAYYSRFLTANSTGAVQFSLKTGCGAPCGTLPTGLTLDGVTGAVSGLPTGSSGNYDITVVADDDLGTVELATTLHVTSAGGGGNLGASFSTSSLPTGRVGVAYNALLSPSNGIGPFTYGAQDLPTGITINGSTGVVSGTPQVAGTFYVTFSLRDAGETNSVIATIPMTIFPADSAQPPTYVFQFDTITGHQLTNGEVGTAYSDTYFVTDEDGAVNFSATGLPPGLTLNPATGVVSGTPTTAGTFYVLISATDSGTGATISLNLPMWIAPHPSSDFYWNFFGVPAAFAGADYHRVPPLLINALNGVTVVYSAVGLPQGISYNSGTGELGGTTYDVGVYPVTFTATDTATGEVLTLSFDFIVLPPGGGDANRLAVNLWIKKLSAKVKTDASTAPNDSWQAQYIYNADRRSGKIFNPVTQSMVMALADSTGTVAPMYFKQSSSGVFSYKTPKGLLPGLQVKGTPSNQTLSVKVSATELGFTLFPADRVANNITLGSKAYKLKTFLDSKGKFVPTSSYRNASFVVSAAKVKDVGKTSDNVSLSMYLADPSLLADYTFLQCDKTNKNCNQPTVKLKLYNAADVILDKDLTALVASTRTLDKNSLPIYKMKKVVKKDPSVGNNLTQFSFDSKKGLVKVSLKDLVLANPGLDSWQSQVGVELQIGSASYYTSITLFESKNNSNTYSSKISKYASPF